MKGIWNFIRHPLITALIGIYIMVSTLFSTLALVYAIHSLQYTYAYSDYIPVVWFIFGMFLGLTHLALGVLLYWRKFQ